jgi:Fur family ferric uptake transcriptional regulator
LPSQKNYQEVLSREGIKSTKTRSAVLAILENADTPLTAEEIYLKLKEAKVSSWLSTVYRTLEILAEKNLIIKSSMIDEGKARYEMNRQEHFHHVICVNCRKMFSVGDCPLSDFEQNLKDKLNFNVTGHKLEIYGYCRDCKEVK